METLIVLAAAWALVAIVFRSIVRALLPDTDRGHAPRR